MRTGSANGNDEIAQDLSNLVQAGNPERRSQVLSSLTPYQVGSKFAPRQRNPVTASQTDDISPIQSTIPSGSTGVKTPGAGQGARVVVRGLCKSYQHGGSNLPVLKNVELTLAAGDMVAVVGASGVGKSTFLQILGTLDLPTSGTIQFDGEELTSMSASRLAQFRNNRIGFVFQFHHLLPEFTAVENVMMPCLVQRMDKVKARKMASDMLGRVGLSSRMTHRPSELSGGEQQRVALARAMVLGPALLLADEPTGNLDRSTGASIHELFLQLNHESGSTMLIVTHNLELADLMPRRLKMIDGGRLEDAGDSGESPYRPPGQMPAASELA